MKTLTLIRHAKSDWDDANLTDFDRPLNSRGKKDAPEMGRELAERDFMPDQIITSPAKRAMSTAKRIAKAIEFPKDAIQTDERIYEASLATLMEIVNELDDAADHVALIGHNPGLTELGNHLTGDDIANLPTCSVLSISFDVDSWNEVWEDSGQVDFYDDPKQG